MKITIEELMREGSTTEELTTEGLNEDETIFLTGGNSADLNDVFKEVSQSKGALKNIFLKEYTLFNINEPLLIFSNTTFLGAKTAKLKLVDRANWSAWTPMIREGNASSSNITIKGFTIDGNREGNTGVLSGKGYHNLIHLTGCQNINVFDMYLTNGHGDGLRVENCSDIKLSNNKIYLLGNDGFYAGNCSGVEACNNNITCRTNSGLRLYNSNHCKLHDNTITSQGSGGAGIEIQKYGAPEMDDIEVYNNVIYKTMLAGIWIFGSNSYPASSANVHIHHNQIYDTGTRSMGGIFSNGFNGLIENNVIDGAYGAGILQGSAYSSVPEGAGFVLTLKNNIITNTRDGIAVSNKLPYTHSFQLQGNCLFGNLKGDYENVEVSPSDIKADPQFVDKSKHDYRLKLISPCPEMGIATLSPISITNYDKIKGATVVSVTEDDKTRMIECIVLEKDGKKYTILPFRGSQENFIELKEN